MILVELEIVYVLCCVGQFFASLFGITFNIVFAYTSEMLLL